MGATTNNETTATINSPPQNEQQPQPTSSCVGGGGVQYVYRPYYVSVKARKLSSSHGGFLSLQGNNPIKLTF